MTDNSIFIVPIHTTKTPRTSVNLLDEISGILGEKAITPEVVAYVRNMPIKEKSIANEDPALFIHCHPELFEMKSFFKPETKFTTVQSEKSIAGYAAQQKMKSKSNIPMAIVKNDESIAIILEVPGMHKEELDIELDGSFVLVKVNKGEKYANCYICTIEVEQNASIYVGPGYTETDFKTSYDDGILTIVYPSPETKAEMPKRIIVQ